MSLIDVGLYFIIAGVLIVIFRFVVIGSAMYKHAKLFLETEEEDDYLSMISPHIFEKISKLEQRLKKDNFSGLLEILIDCEIKDPKELLEFIKDQYKRQGSIVAVYEIVKKDDIVSRALLRWIYK